MAPLDTLAATIAQRIGKALPIHPYALAHALGLKLHQRSGAVYALRDGAIMMDSRWSRAEREAITARACAVFLLHRSGLLRTARRSDVAWLTERLCGVPVEVVERTGVVPLVADEHEALARDAQSA